MSMCSGHLVTGPFRSGALLASWITGVCLVCTSFSLEVMSLCTEGLLFTVLRFPLHVQFIVGLLTGMK